MSEELFKVRLLTHDIVEVVLDRNVYLDVSVTDRIDQEIQRLAPDRKVYQIVIANYPYIVNPEMRNAMAKGDTGIKILALAWVSPDEAANREQEEIVSHLPIPLPIRFFSERQKGIDWLMSLAHPK
jgi:hypothetical protein